jgi:hypothetical protein
MHLKLFLKLKKPLKLSLLGQYIKKPQKTPNTQKKPKKKQKTPKNPKKPKKNPLGWVFLNYPGFFQPWLDYIIVKNYIKIFW